MTSDLALLEDYVRNGVQASFGELLNRHLPLVYSAALRQVRSPQLAEEVALSVFTDLARSAGKLKPDTVVAAWLYQVTRRKAIDVVRRESRRQLREQVASEMNAMNATPDDWTHVEPLLDDAMEALDETDRTAILLRYFENKSLHDVGRDLGVSEDAAQKRVSRAVERLREFFNKREVKIGVHGLVAVLSANAAQAVPTGLAATISAGATAGLAATGATATAIQVIAITTLQKALVTATVVALAGAGIYVGSQILRSRGEIRALQDQQWPLTLEVRRLQVELNEATNSLAALREDNELLNRNTSEGLRLRAQSVRLAEELRELKAAATRGGDGRELVAGQDASDSTVFTASVTNRVNNGHTMVIGGWSNKGLRTYLLFTPIIQPGDDERRAHRLSIESQTIEAPEDFWRRMGWGPVGSNARRSRLAGVLAPDEIDAVRTSVEEVDGAKISTSSRALVSEGEGFGVALTADDESNSGVGVVMDLRVLARISRDGQSVDIELSPETPSYSIPPHSTLGAANP